MMFLCKYLYVMGIEMWSRQNKKRKRGKLRQGGTIGTRA